MKKNITIVVPCYNEEKMLKIFHTECNKVLEKIDTYNFEYIFVNDGSSDDTLLNLKEIAEEDKRVRFISFSRNFGKEAAILAGLKNAKGDYVVLMDADLQHPPELITQMISYLEKGYDSVSTKRKSRKGESFVREYCSKLFYKITNSISDIVITKGATDYRIMSREMVDSVLELCEYHRFSKGIFEWVGYDTKWIEYESEDRVEGESKWSFLSLFRYAIEGFVSFSTTPLKISSIVGAISASGSFVYLIYIIFRTLIYGIDVAGYASIICLIMFFGGIQLIVLGIMGEYLARTYMESKRRPNYLVKEHNIEK